MIHVLILAWLSVLLGDNGHGTMETIGLTISIALGIFLILAAIGRLGEDE